MAALDPQGINQYDRFYHFGSDDTKLKLFQITFYKENPLDDGMKGRLLMIGDNGEIIDSFELEDAKLDIRTQLSGMFNTANEEPLYKDDITLNFTTRRTASQFIMSLKPERVMTKEEIERELGYKIQIID